MKRTILIPAIVAMSIITFSLYARILPATKQDDHLTVIKPVNLKPNLKIVDLPFALLVIVDSVTNTPIPNVPVQVQSSSTEEFVPKVGQTTSDGKFPIFAEPGKYYVMINSGSVVNYEYKSVDFTIPSSEPITIKLEKTYDLKVFIWNENEKPIVGGDVEVNNKLGSGCETNDKGMCVLKLKKGTYTISAKDYKNYGEMQFQNLSKTVTIPSNSESPSFIFYSPKEANFSVRYKDVVNYLPKKLYCLTDEQAKSALTGPIKIDIDHAAIVDESNYVKWWDVKTIEIADILDYASTDELVILQPIIDTDKMGGSDGFGSENVGKQVYIANIEIPTKYKAEAGGADYININKYVAVWPPECGNGKCTIKMIFTPWNEDLNFHIILSENGFENCPLK